MTRAKQDYDKKPTIMDLSWPPNYSVNSGVRKDIYLDTIYSLHYLSIDNITEALVKQGPAAQLYKIGISQAFQHLRVDQADIDLLGFQVSISTTILTYRHRLDFIMVLCFFRGVLMQSGIL